MPGYESVLTEFFVDLMHKKELEVKEGNVAKIDGGDEVLTEEKDESVKV
jgi:hypothetical protein